MLIYISGKEKCCRNIWGKLQFRLNWKMHETDNKKWRIRNRIEVKMVWKRNGKFLFKSTGIKIIWNGMEMEWKFHHKRNRCKMEWNWNGNGMEISPQKKWMQNGMEMEWNWNGNGMEINGHPDMKVKLNGMEWKRKEMEWRDYDEQ